MKKAKDLEASKVCPFRSQIQYEYADFGNGNIFINAQTETFPECYGSRCPHYQYEVTKGFFCTQIEEGASDE